MIEMLPYSPETPKHWETALEAVKDGVCLLGPDGRISRCNRSAAAVLEQPTQAIIGQPADKVLARAFGAIRPERVAYAGGNPRPQTVELARDARTFQITILAVLDDSGELCGSVLTIVETTDRSRLLEDERLLRKHVNEAEALRDEATKMASLEQLKSQFLRLASHELRSPVAILQGYLSMLADGSLGDLPETARSVIPVMSAKMLEMNLLIDQLLDTARLEDSRLALKLEQFDLADVVAEAVQAVRPLAGSGHAISIQRPTEALEVIGDRARLRMVVTNLVENAVKYSPQGGYIECSVGPWDGRATVAVRDTGIGIAPDQMDLLFTRFGRLVSDATEHIPGTGLGLYLSRELARMHGGDLTAESTVGQGSVFTLRLPLASERL